MSGFGITALFEPFGWNLTVVFLLLLFVYLYGTFPYWRVSGVKIPCAKPWPWFGNLPDMIKYGELHKLHLAYVQKYGRIFKMFLGRSPIIVVAEPELLKQIMVKQFQNFHDRKVPVLPKPPLNNVVSILKGQDWKRVRSIITPSFTGGKLKKMVPLMEECNQVLMKRLSEFARSGTPVNAVECMRRYALDVILSVGLGTKIPNLQIDPDPLLLQRANEVLKMPWYVRFNSLLPFPSLWGFLSIINNSDYFVELVTTIINKRRCAGDDIPKRSDVIDLLLSAHHDVHGSKSLSDDEIIAQSMVVLLAGQETTTNALSFAAHCLATHPDIQERLAQEIDVAWSNKGDKSLYEMVHGIQYLDMVLKEVLRFCPPAFYVNRFPEHDVDIDGIHFPGGVEVGIPVYSIHHDPDLWPEPNKFDPDRFTPEAEEKLHPCQYIPFGTGPRACVGMRLAQLGLKLTLCNILRQFKFERSPKTEDEIDLTLSAFTLAPKHGVYVKIKSRK